MTKFQLGQNALDVCKVIINHHPEILVVRLVAHKVDNNWRQRYQATSEKLKYIIEGFEHSRPTKEQKYSREEFSLLTLDDLSNLGENQVWSITSKVQCVDGKIKHLPMMNFHPEKGPRLRHTQLVLKGKKNSQAGHESPPDTAQILNCTVKKHLRSKVCAIGFVLVGDLLNGVRITSN